MADKFLSASSVRAGSTSVSIVVELTDGDAAITGIAHTDLTSASYLRQGGLRVGITLSALGSVNAAFSSGGWVELDATNLPGLYRLDVPDGAFATGAEWVVVDVADGSTLTTHNKVIALPTFGHISDSVLDAVVETEGSYTLQQALSIMLSVLAGRTTNGGLTFKTANNNATRVTATTNSDKERTAMTLNPSS